MVLDLLPQPHELFLNGGIAGCWRCHTRAAELSLPLRFFDAAELHGAASARTREERCSTLCPSGVLRRHNPSKQGLHPILWRQEKRGSVHRDGNHLALAQRIRELWKISGFHHHGNASEHTARFIFAGERTLRRSDWTLDRVASASPYAFLCHPMAQCWGLLFQAEQ